MSLFSPPSFNFTLNTLSALLSHSLACLPFIGTQYLAMLHLGESLDQVFNQKKFKVIQKQVASNFRVQRRILHTITHWLNTTLSGKGQVRALPEEGEKVGKRWIVYTLLTLVHCLISKNSVDSWWLDAERKDEHMNKWIAKELTNRKKQEGETMFISL